MTQKTCSRCKTLKTFDGFHIYKSGKRKGIPHSWCIVCTRSYQLDTYHNSDDVKDRYNDTYRKKVLLKQQLFWEYLEANPCVRCGESNPLTLELDHTIPLLNNKAKRIASMISNGTSWSSVLQAISDQDCQVLCANCHTAKTHQDQNSWRWKRWSHFNDK